MIGVIEDIRTVISLKPSKWTVLALAVMGAALVLQLLVAANAGPSIDGGYRR